MQAPEYDYLDRTIIPAVAGAIGMGPHEQDALSLTSPSTAEPGSGAPTKNGDGKYSAAVYWQALYVCKAYIDGPVLVLFSWRDSWKHLGRQRFTVEEYQEPEADPGLVQLALTEQDLEVVMLCVSFTLHKAQGKDYQTIDGTLNRLHGQTLRLTGKNLLTKAGCWPATWG